jgi:hypothetical protein
LEILQISRLSPKQPAKAAGVYIIASSLSIRILDAEKAENIELSRKNDSGAVTNWRY